MSIMITTEIIKSINNSVLCWLATTSANGHPNVSPKEIFSNYGDQYLLIANIMSPQSIKNIKARAKVSVSFVDILVQKGFQLKGTAEIVNRKEDAFEEIHKPLFKIAGPDYPIISVIKIKVQSVKPIIAPRYVLFPETTESQQIESAKKTYRLK